MVKAYEISLWLEIDQKDWREEKYSFFFDKLHANRDDKNQQEWQFQ